MKKIKNIHPGEILCEEFLKPRNITAYQLSKETDISQTRISEIIRGKRGISTDTALRLSKYFGNSPQFWLGLQADYDVEEQSKTIVKELDRIQSYSSISKKKLEHAH